MEDRFKFRAWNKNQEYMYKNIDTPSTYDAEHLILMQCTGLKDKNGKLIYEGDKLKPDEVNSVYEEVVVWDEDDAMFKVRGLYSDEEWNGLYSESVEDYVYEPLSDYRDIEIIGNIYENKELLEA